MMKKIEIIYLINLYKRIIEQITDEKEKEKIKHHLSNLYIKLAEREQIEDN